MIQAPAGKKTWLVLLLLPLLFSWACPPGPDDNTVYRDRMRSLVQQLAAYARRICPAFIITPQNGHELITLDGKANGPLAEEYVNTLSGMGREELFYGYTADNVATPPETRDAMLAFLDLAEREGVEVLATDYCWTPNCVDDSASRSNAHGFISFAAHRRELDAIPPYPATPFRVNGEDCTSLAQARNFLYLINPGSYEDRTHFLDALRGSDFDVLIIDLFVEGETLTAAEVASLKTKAHGGRRLVMAYLSIGEAEDYRYYWNPAWKSNPPSWLDEENREWPGNYKVKYWESGWQEILFGNDLSYVKRILEAGFDGAYLDLVDAYEYWEERQT